MASFSESRKIAISDLRVGMYVSRLELPWQVTEFPLEGVLVRNQLDIMKLRPYGKTLYIDLARSQDNSRSELFQSKPAASKPANKPLWQQFCKHSYPIQTKVSKEIRNAKKILKNADSVFTSIKPELTRLDEKTLGQLRDLSVNIVASVLNNPDALLWISKVKTRHGQVYDHTLRCAIWATLMSRSMGLEVSSIRALIQAILLSGVGKACLKPSDWIDYQGGKMTLSYARWPALTLQKLKNCHLEPRVRTIIENMTERYNGEGYPAHKKANAIPYLSQIASLVESFDIMLHPELKERQGTIAQVFCKLHRLAGNLFDQNLVEELVLATGLYPAGTPVILSNGYQGLVVEQSKSRRIRATVALTHNSEGYRLLRYRVIRLDDGDYKNVFIQQESTQNQMLDMDMKQINQLLRHYQTSGLQRFFQGVGDLIAG